MRVNYQFSTGSLAITMFETPFQLSMEFNDLNKCSWYSAKYTVGSVSKLKLAIRGTSQFSTTMEERVTAIWHMILRRPMIAIVGSILIVTIAPGIEIPLIKEKIKPILEPVIESPEYEDDCKCRRIDYDIAKCTTTTHLRCANDISMIRDLQNENERLHAEIVSLRRLTIRDNSLLMRDSTLMRGG